MLFARVILVIQLVALAGLGLAYFVRPHEMANLSGMLLMAPAAATDVRAYYGGLQIGLAAVLALALSRLDLTRAALTADQLAHAFTVYPSMSGSIAEAARRLHHV